MSTFNSSVRAVALAAALAAPVLANAFNLGTARASGCTSGRGVGGLARFSPRSVVATATFLGVTIAKTYVVRHVVGVV